MRNTGGSKLSVHHSTDSDAGELGLLGKNFSHHLVSSLQFGAWAISALFKFRFTDLFILATGPTLRFSLDLSRSTR
jgi:hypothetical protein